MHSFCEGKKAEKVNSPKQNHEELVIPQKTVRIIAPYVADYRKQSAIINEYGLLCNLYYSTHHNEKMTKDIFESILAIAAYKNLMPMDYNSIRVHKSVVIPNYKPKKIDLSLRGVMDALAGGDDPVLKLECLYYVGFTKDEINHLYVIQFEDSLETTLAQSNVNDTAFIDAFKQYRKSIGGQIEEKAYEELTESSLDKIKQISMYMIEHSINDIAWLFNDKMSALNVFKIICSLQFQEEQIKKLYALNGFDENGSKSIFDRCKQEGSRSPTLNAFWNLICTSDEFRVIRLGLGKQYSEGNHTLITVDGEKVRLERN